MFAQLEIDLLSWFWLWVLNNGIYINTVNVSIWLSIYERNREKDHIVWKLRALHVSSVDVKNGFSQWPEK